MGEFTVNIVIFVCMLPWLCNNLSLYAFAPTHISLVILPFILSLTVFVERLSDWYTPVGVRGSAVELGQIQLAGIVA